MEETERVELIRRTVNVGSFILEIVLRAILFQTIFSIRFHFLEHEMFFRWLGITNRIDFRFISNQLT